MPEPRPKERSLILRLPEHYVIALDGIVEQSKGKFRSRNSLMTDIIGIFLSELKSKALEGAKTGR